MDDGKDGRADEDHDHNDVHNANNATTGNYHVVSDDENKNGDSKDDNHDEGNNGDCDDNDDNDDTDDRGAWTWGRMRVRVDWQPTLATQILRTNEWLTRNG